MPLLVSYALRRALSPALAALGLPLLALAVRDVLLSPEWVREAGAGFPHLVRARVLGLGLLLLLPSVLVPAAGHAARVLREERDWTAGRLQRPAAAALVRAGASVLLAGLLVLLAGLVAELAGRACEPTGPGPTWRPLARPALAPRVLDRATDALEVELRAAPGDAARVRVGLLPGSGPAATVRVALGATVREVRVQDGSTLAVEVPPDDTRGPRGGERPLALRVSRVGEGAAVLLPRDPVTLVRPVRGGPPGALRAALDLLPWAALTVLATLLAGAWVRPGLALGLGLVVAWRAPVAPELALLRQGLSASAGSLFPAALPWVPPLVLGAVLLGLVALAARRRGGRS